MICRAAGIALWLSLLAAGAAAATEKPEEAASALSAIEVGDAVDLSALNHKPAGRFGRVRAEGDQLVWGNGRPARFWGVNLQAYALFRTPDAEIERHAARLARLGVNLVRLHHHDSDWVSPNIFGPRKTRSPQLDKAALERLDRWIAALKSHGIYLWLDLHVGRTLSPDLPIEHVGELAQTRRPGDLRGYNFVNPDIKIEMQRVTEAYLGHVNRYTGLAYKDDPAIAVVLISNENDLTKHFANRLLPGKAAPEHSALYMAAAEAFAEEHGLSRRQVWRANGSRAAMLFLNDLEHRFFADMITHLREIGYDGVIATSSFWGGMPRAGLASLSLGDIIDVHSYGRSGWLNRPPGAKGDMFTPIGAAHLAGKPLSISEWNLSPFPAADRGIAALHMAALAGFQGWDAPVLYGYAQRSLKRMGKPGNWHAASDPTMMGAFPAAALLFRGQQIQPARTQYIYRPDARSFYRRPPALETRTALRAMIGQHRLQTELPVTPELPWLAPHPLDSLDFLFSETITRQAGEQEIVSDTGEIRQVLARPIGTNRTEETGGQLLIDSPYAQIAAGDLAQAPVLLSGARFALEAPNGLVALQSLDGAPISRARRLLLSVIAPTEPGPDEMLSALPVHGALRFRGPPGLRIEGRSPAMADLVYEQDEGWYNLRLDGAPATLLITLSRP